ncbi:MAG: substrate-binding domain-containing protein, partial [Anaerolineae bacterium]|nr:substrate-binding domain-containing protein [Anaerolineae bacterium]
MPYPWRLIRPLVLAVVVMTLIFPAALYAQDEDTPPVLIQGTPELEQFVGAIRDAYAEVYTEADVQIDPAVGQSGAFDALCSGETDIVMASGAISDDQIAACDRQGQTFIELLLAYEAIVFMAPSATGLTCVSEQLMADSWQLGAAEEISWLDLGATAPDAPVSFYGPNDLSAPYRLFSELVPAQALREDIVQTDEVANILDKMREENSDALGFMSLADYDSIAQPDDVEYLFPLDVEDADGNCIVADLTALEDHTYPLVRTSYLYVNAESAARDDVRSFLQFALGDPLGALTIAPDQGYTTPLPASYEYALNNLSSSVTGRTFSRPLTPVRVDSATMGIVTVAGSSMPFSVVRPVNLSFEQKFVNAEVETNTFGNTSGWAEFCGGFADVLMASREPTADELAVCTDAGIDPYMIDLGYDAVIAAVPSGNDWLECLDGETVLSLLRAGTDEAPAPALWSDLNAEWPESSLLIVTPPNSTGETDFMVFALAQDLTFVMRADVVEDDDPLYRVQGVANTAQDEANPNNGFTYLSWSEFKDSAADVRLVGAGKDCVVPDATTITGGSYPL